MVGVAVIAAGGMMSLVGAGTLYLPYAFVCRNEIAVVAAVASVVHVAGGAPVL